MLFYYYYINVFGFGLCHVRDMRISSSHFGSISNGRTQWRKQYAVHLQFNHQLNDDSIFRLLTRGSFFIFAFLGWWLVENGRALVCVCGVSTLIKHQTSGKFVENLILCMNVLTRAHENRGASSIGHPKWMTIAICNGHNTVAHTATASAYHESALDLILMKLYFIYFKIELNRMGMNGRAHEKQKMVAFSIFTANMTRLNFTIFALRAERTKVSLSPIDEIVSAHSAQCIQTWNMHLDDMYCPIAFANSQFLYFMFLFCYERSPNELPSSICIGIGSWRNDSTTKNNVFSAQKH